MRGWGSSRATASGRSSDRTGWPGRYNSYRAKIQEVEINPNIAWKINDKFSIAAGVVASYFNVTLQRACVPALGR